MALAAMLLLVTLVSFALIDRFESNPFTSLLGKQNRVYLPVIVKGRTGGASGGGQAALYITIPGEPEAFSSPYTHYTLTQGLHGYSYGHAAIDISAGNGAAILSPINGIVSSLYVDDLANTVLIIENEVYQVLMMHGNYSVNVGDILTLGQPIGTESNNGWTKDAFGQLCYGRDCGYHTHLNVCDKRLGSNINPLDVIKN